MGQRVIRHVFRHGIVGQCDRAPAACAAAVVGVRTSLRARGQVPEQDIAAPVAGGVDQNAGHGLRYVEGCRVPRLGHRLLGEKQILVGILGVNRGQHRGAAAVKMKGGTLHVFGGIGIRKNGRRIRGHIRIMVVDLDSGVNARMRKRRPCFASAVLQD